MASIPGAASQVVTIGFPGGDYGDSKDQVPVVSTAVEAAYKVPPAVWCVVFLIVGYIGIRWIMED